MRVSSSQSWPLRPEGIGRWVTDKAAGWKPLHEFTARFLASSQEEEEASAKSMIETAVSQLLVREPHSKLVLFLGTMGCPRFWNVLQDTGGD